MDTNYRLRIAKVVRERLAEKGWSQNVAAERAGYETRTLRNILGGVPVRAATLAAFYEALDLPWPPEHEEPAL